MITKQQIIDDLAKKIFAGESKIEIGKWAYAMYLKKIIGAESDFYDILLDLAAMEYGSKHELSEDQLDQILTVLGVRQNPQYKKIFFGRDLKKHLRDNTSAADIGRWVYTLYVDDVAGNDRSFDDLIYTLMGMEEGPEFEYSYNKLNNIADRLIAGEDVKL